MESSITFDQIADHLKSAIPVDIPVSDSAFRSYYVECDKTFIGQTHESNTFTEVTQFRSDTTAVYVSKTSLIQLPLHINAIDSLEFKLIGTFQKYICGYLHLGIVRNASRKIDTPNGGGVKFYHDEKGLDVLKTPLVVSIVNNMMCLTPRDPISKLLHNYGGVFQINMFVEIHAEITPPFTLEHSYRYIASFNKKDQEVIKNLLLEKEPDEVKTQVIAIHQQIEQYFTRSRPRSDPNSTFENISIRDANTEHGGMSIRSATDYVKDTYAIVKNSSDDIKKAIDDKIIELDSSINTLDVLEKIRARLQESLDMHSKGKKLSVVLPNHEITEIVNTIGKLKTATFNFRDETLFNQLRDPTYVPNLMTFQLFCLTCHSVARLDLMCQILRRLPRSKSIKKEVPGEKQIGLIRPMIYTRTLNTSIAHPYPNGKRGYQIEFELNRYNGLYTDAFGNAIHNTVFYIKFPSDIGDIEDVEIDMVNPGLFTSGQLEFVQIKPLEYIAIAPDMVFMDVYDYRQHEVISFDDLDGIEHKKSISCWKYRAKGTITFTTSGVKTSQGAHVFPPFTVGITISTDAVVLSSEAYQSIVDISNKMNLEKKDGALLLTKKNGNQVVSSELLIQYGDFGLLEYDNDDD